MYTQLIPFDPSKGGNVPLDCLINVDKGYGISGKYPDAWTAWEHTQQHFDPVPSGLSVPLFYSYTTTIDGETKNYGHINVQLPDGTVWSDGTIYPSIQGYESNHLPRFVGWGLSVNDFNIIEEVINMSVTILGVGSVSWSDGRIDVFARGSDNSLYHKWYENKWNPWELIAGTKGIVLSAPTASSWAVNRLDVFWEGPAGDLVHTWYDGKWNTPESLGVPLA